MKYSKFAIAVFLSSILFNSVATAQPEVSERKSNLCSSLMNFTDKVYDLRESGTSEEVVISLVRGNSKQYESELNSLLISIVKSSYDGDIDLRYARILEIRGLCMKNIQN